MKDGTAEVATKRLLNSSVSLPKVVPRCFIKSLNLRHDVGFFVV